MYFRKPVDNLMECFLGKCGELCLATGDNRVD